MDNDQLFRKADKLYEEGNFGEAFSMFSLAAENGDVSSMTRVASMYSCGEGVDCDYDKAIEWELKAIDGGEISAMVNVGISYRIKGHIREAKRWFQQALKAGDGSAALELAKLYMVSDMESEAVKRYLQLAIESTNMCEADIEEAKQLLVEMQ
jgi:TPR repeat protein